MSSATLNSVENYLKDRGRERGLSLVVGRVRSALDWQRFLRRTTIIGCCTTALLLIAAISESVFPDLLLVAITGSVTFLAWCAQYIVGPLKDDIMLLKGLYLLSPMGAAPSFRSQLETSGIMDELRYAGYSISVWGPNEESLANEMVASWLSTDHFTF